MKLYAYDALKSNNRRLAIRRILDRRYIKKSRHTGKLRKIKLRNMYLRSFINNYSNKIVYIKSLYRVIDQ